MDAPGDGDGDGGGRELPVVASRRAVRELITRAAEPGEKQYCGAA